MNSSIDLLSRLLKLYPVKLIKNFFNPESSNQAEIIPEIIGANTEKAIKDFACENHDSTKQHIFLFTLNNKFIKDNFVEGDFPFSIDTQLLTNNVYKFKLLPVIDFNVVILNPFEEATLKFYQPVTVCLNDKHLIIQTTIMEKNMDSYFPEARRVVDVKKANSEEYIVEKILEYFSIQYTVTKNDLNRGIKDLWRNDVIDSKYAKWKKERSTTTEAMDEEYTLKEQYPEIYENLMLSPLGKTVFKYKLDDDLIIKHFTADPTKGWLSFATYPENQNQIDNVINKILSSN
jgi:hypothetical protein